MKHPTLEKLLSEYEKDWSDVFTLYDDPKIARKEYLRFRKYIRRIFTAGMIEGVKMVKVEKISEDTDTFTVQGYNSAVTDLNIKKSRLITELEGEVKNNG